MTKIIYKILIVVFISCLFCISSSFVLAQGLNKIEVTTIDQFQKVAPGESLPVAIKLLNMGGSGRVDVQITYRIENADKIIISEELETVAVETTANFIKQVKIPPNLRPGKYFISADMIYPDQKVPAITRLPFFVEYKFFGFFLDQLMILALAVILSLALILTIVHFINKSRKIIVSNFDYKDVPAQLKPYYDLISDIILNMRMHMGDKAIKLANQIEGLKISDLGKVLAMEKEPMEIVTLLTIEFEKDLGYGGIYISEKALNFREKNTKILEEKIEYQKTAKLLGNVSKYFAKK